MPGSNAYLKYTEALDDLEPEAPGGTCRSRIDAKESGRSGEKWLLNREYGFDEDGNDHSYGSVKKDDHDIE